MENFSEVSLKVSEYFPNTCAGQKGLIIRAFSDLNEMNHRYIVLAANSDIGANLTEHYLRSGTSFLHVPNTEATGCRSGKGRCQATASRGLLNIIMR